MNKADQQSGRRLKGRRARRRRGAAAVLAAPDTSPAISLRTRFAVPAGSWKQAGHGRTVADHDAGHRTGPTHDGPRAKHHRMGHLPLLRPDVPGRERRPLPRPPRRRRLRHMRGMARTTAAVPSPAGDSPSGGCQPASVRGTAQPSRRGSLRASRLVRDSDSAGYGGVSGAAAGIPVLMRGRAACRPACAGTPAQ